MLLKFEVRCWHHPALRPAHNTSTGWPGASPPMGWKVSGMHSQSIRETHSHTGLDESPVHDKRAHGPQDLSYIGPPGLSPQKGMVMERYRKWTGPQEAKVLDPGLVQPAAGLLTNRGISGPCCLNMHSKEFEPDDCKCPIRPSTSVVLFCNFWLNAFYI